MKVRFRIALVLLFAPLAHAQFTTVTGTVVDPHGVPYSLGTITPTLVANGTPTLNGFPYTPPTQPVGLDKNGFFSFNIADNTQLQPPSTKWNFVVCSAVGTTQPAVGTGSQCFTLPTSITIAGATQNISTVLNAAATALTIPFGTATGPSLPAGVAKGSALVSNGTGALIPPVYQTKPIFDTRDFVTCDGSTDVTASFQTLAQAIGTSTPSTLRFVRDSTNTGPCVLENFGFSSNITLDYTGGGALKTLTSSTPTGGMTPDDAGSGASFNTSSNSCSVTVTPSAAGEAYLLYTAFGFGGGTVLNGPPTSTQANDIILLEPAFQSNTNVSMLTDLWIVSNATAGARTFTFSYSLSTWNSCGARAIAGAGPILVLGGSASLSGTANPMTSGSLTATAGDFLFAFGGQHNNTETCTATGGFTQPAGSIGQIGTSGTVCTMQINSAAGGAITANQNISSAPTGLAWTYNLLALHPGSATISILGGIEDPDLHPIFQGQGTIDFTGAPVLDRVYPEWWGVSPSASGSANLLPMQQAFRGAFGTNRTNQSGLTKYNRPLYFTSLYHINGEIQCYHCINFLIYGSGRLSSGIIQDGTNQRIIDGQSIAYGVFYNTSFSTTASQTVPLLDLDFNGVTTPGDLAEQFIDFYSVNFSGGQLGVLIAKSGGSAQGSNNNFWDIACSNQTLACIQIGGNGIGPNAGRSYAQNAIINDVWNGDVQGAPMFGIASYGGSINVHGTSFENGFASQTGYDIYCEAAQETCVVENVRSESRRLAAGNPLKIVNSRTIDQFFFPVPGSSAPVGTIIHGSNVSAGTGGQQYYKVTVNGGPGSPFGGAGQPNAPQFATGGSATTIVNANDTTPGSVTSIPQCAAPEVMTQSVTGSTATLVAINGGVMWSSAPTGAPDASHTWIGGTTGCVFTPTGPPAATNYTVNAFTGFQVSTLSGTNAGCYGIVTSNTAQTVTVTSWLTTYGQVLCSAPDSTSTFVVEPNWGTQTTSGGMTWAPLNEIGLCGLLDATTLACLSGTVARIENMDLPGDQASLQLNDTTTTVDTLHVTRPDWLITSGNLNNNFNASQIKNVIMDFPALSQTGGKKYQSWKFNRTPIAGGTVIFNGYSQNNVGTQPIVWSAGVQGGGVAADDVWIGGRSDPGSANDHTRAILEYSGLLGPASPFGTNLNGSNAGVTGGLSSGNGTPGNWCINTGTTGGAGTQVNPGAARWCVVGAAGNLVAQGSQGIQPATYLTLTNCAVNSVSPAACGSAPSGAVVIPTTTTTYTINTTAVTAHSRIQLTWLSFASDLPGGPTCVAPVSTTEPTISAVSAGVSFTITLGSTTGQTCPMFQIVN
jgi:hypothetical protein